MCDYSLMSIPNRLAVEGENLIAHRFTTGTMGWHRRRMFTEWWLRRRQPVTYSRV